MSKRDRKKKPRRPGQPGGRVTPPKVRQPAGDGPDWGFGAAPPGRRHAASRSTHDRRDSERSLPPLRTLVGAAIDARFRDDGDRFAVALDGVAAHAAEPGGRRVVERVVAEEIVRFVGAAWKFGWQPADLVRVTARMRSGPERRLLATAVAVEARAYLPTTVDPDWADQVRAIVDDVAATGGGLPPDGDTTWVTSGADLRDAIEVALSLAGFMAGLPRLPVLCRLPGKGSSRGPSGHHVDEGVLRRVRGLLAKAESTPFEEEAAVFTSKAQELMARHAIDRVALAADDVRSDVPAGVRLGIDDPYAQVKATLLAEVAEANRCRAVWSKGFGFATVFGFADDLDAVELLYTSLLVQATVSMASYGSRRTADGRSRTRSFRKSFLLSFTIRVGHRLRDAADAVRDDAVERHGGSLLPVLADRRAAVDDAVTAAFPEMTTAAASAATDAEGWAAGRAAADLAALWGADEVEVAGA